MWKRWISLLLIALVLSGGGLCAGAASQQAALAGKLIRLHIRGASDAPEDQARKLAVRDAILPQVAALTAGCADADQAAAALKAGLPALADRAAGVLGTGEPAAAYLTRENFPRRDYDSFSLPAGEYRALRIDLGAAAGHNWWCVAFPALCLPAVADFEEAAREGELTEQELTLLREDSLPVRFRFRILDWLAEIFGD